MRYQVTDDEVLGMEIKWKEVVDTLLELRDKYAEFQRSAPDVRSPEVLGPVLCRVYQMHFHRMSFAAMLDDIVYELNHRGGLTALTPKHPVSVDSEVAVPEPVEPPTPPVEKVAPRKVTASTTRPRKGHSTEVVTVGPPEVLRNLGIAADQLDSNWTPEAEAVIRGPLPPPDTGENQ